MEHKQQTTTETINLDTASSSCFSETEVNIKSNHLSNFNDHQNLTNTEDEHENKKVSVGNHKELVTRHQKKDGGNLNEEQSKVQEPETSLQSPHTDGSDESDVAEHDVKVCDTCGDAGREDLLAICCRCIDGAEHTYCMRVMVDQVPKGDWLCEECKLEEVKNTTQRSNTTENSAGSEQSSDAAVGKVSAKSCTEELTSSSSFKKQALETIIGSTEAVEHGKVKPIHQFSSESHFGNESTEESHSPATRPQLQSLRGAFSKSSSFSFLNARSKTKPVDEIFLQRQKSTKERSSHDTLAAKEMSKPMSFRSTNLGSFGPSGSKGIMLSPKLAHVQDLKSPKNKKERSFEKTNSVKLSSSSSATLTPKIDRLLSTRGESNSVHSGSNSEVKLLRVDSKTISGFQSTNRQANISSEAPVSLGRSNEQLPSSPTRVGTASSSGVVNSVEQKSISNSSKVELSKESINLADGTKENTTGMNPGSAGVSCQNNKETCHSAQGSHGNNVSAIKTSKDVKNGDNKLKDAIEAALLKKPGIYRKNKVSDQPDESSVPTMNHEAAVVDRVPHSRIVVGLTSNVDHSKQSNGNSYKQSMILPTEGKHMIAGLFSHDDVALSSLLKNTPIPNHDCIWQGSFEINRSGKTAEFWDGLQAHLSTCASPRVFEAVNKFPHKILLNGVSRASAWPTQFENSAVKQDNIAIYFFAKDFESYEKSYQVLVDDMIKSDLALIGRIDGVELLIFPSNRLPEKSNRWNMLFFLWGVFRGKNKNSLHQIPDNSEKNCDPQFVSSSTDKISLAENVCSFGSVEEDEHVDSESKVNSNLQNSSHVKIISNMQSFSHEKAIAMISKPVQSVKHVDLESKVNSIMQSFSHEKAIDIISRPVDSLNHVDPESKINSVMQSFSLKKVVDVISRPMDSVRLVDPDLKVNSNMPSFSHEKAIDIISVDGVKVVPVSSNVIISEIHMPNEPIKRPSIDLSENDDVNGMSQTNTWCDASGERVEQESKRQKSDLHGAGNNSGERYFFPADKGKTQQTPVFALDLNEDISCLVGETDNIIMTKKGMDDVASSLSLSLAFSPPNKDDGDDRGTGKWQSGRSMLHFRNMIDKQ